MKVTNNNININLYINSGNKYSNSKILSNKNQNNEFYHKKNSSEINNLSSINFNNDNNILTNSKSNDKKDLARSNSLNYLFKNYKINNYNDKS